MRDDSGLDQSDISKGDGKWSHYKYLGNRDAGIDDEPVVDFERK